jgi:hypothetical protein
MGVRFPHWLPNFERNDMVLLVWKKVDKVTTRWHDYGGLLVIAESLEAARDKIRSECPEGCGALETEPELSLRVEGVSEQLIVFQDAGCC